MTGADDDAAELRRALVRFLLESSYEGTPQAKVADELLKAVRGVPGQSNDVLARLERALPGWDRAYSGGLASFTGGDHRYLIRRSGTEAATRVYAEAPPDSVRQVRAALGRPPSHGRGSAGT